MQERIKGPMGSLFVLALAGSLLALTGCQHTVVLDVTDKGTGSVTDTPEAHPAIKKGTVLVWTNKSQFWVIFDSSDPKLCKESPESANTYKAEQRGGGPYKVTCTIDTTPPKKKFQYNITFQDPSQTGPTQAPTDQAPPQNQNNGHCSGCSADGDQ